MSEKHIKELHLLIPKEQHRKFSTLACAKGETMSEILRDAIKKFIEDNSNLLELK